jgi:hypothetical protein
VYIPYVAITVLFALMTAISGLFKIRRDPKVIKTIHEIVGVPMQYMNLLAACELAGAAGVLLGIWYPPLGVAAGVGLVIYFLGAVASHMRVGDFAGISPAFFMLALAAGSLALRYATW